MRSDATRSLVREVRCGEQPKQRVCACAQRECSSRAINRHGLAAKLRNIVKIGTKTHSSLCMLNVAAAMP